MIMTNIAISMHITGHAQVVNLSMIQTCKTKDKESMTMVQCMPQKFLGLPNHTPDI
jgi:hypothetical protein